jgi:hypothetical protein
MLEMMAKMLTRGGVEKTNVLREILSSRKADGKNKYETAWTPEKVSSPFLNKSSWRRCSK